MGFPRGLAPFSLFKRSIHLLAQEARGLIICTVMINLAGIVLARVVYEGPLGAAAWIAPDIDYWIRYAAFLLPYIIFCGFIGCIEGRLVLNRTRSQHESFRQIATDSLRRMALGGWIYVPLSLLICVFSEFYFALSIPFAFLTNFYTAGMMLDDLPLATSWREGADMTRRNWIPVLATFGLQTLICWLMYIGNIATNTYLSSVFSVLTAWDMSAALWSVPYLVMTIWSITLYIAAREQITPSTDRLTAVFE
jgi:hypothetical protein